ncbi:MAG: sigma-70 family RNA polymerase sigma factor [Planctomycetaceae bacterium]
MSVIQQGETDDLMRLARAGDTSATSQFLERHRERLRRIVAVRMDPRLVPRFDPSDVVQETLVEALKKLPMYLREQPIPFYPWLRQIAWNRLVDLHRRHMLAAQRSVAREVPLVEAPLSNLSAWQMADQLLADEGSASAGVLRQELAQRLSQAIARLSASHREILVLRHLEDLSVAEVAAILDTTESAVKSRHFRALVRLRELLDSDS